MGITKKDKNVFLYVVYGGGRRRYGVAGRNSLVLSMSPRGFGLGTVTQADYYCFLHSQI